MTHDFASLLDVCPNQCDLLRLPWLPLSTNPWNHHGVPSLSSHPLSSFTFSLMVICMHGIIYCHSYTMSHFLYNFFPSPLVAISKFLLYHHRRTRNVILFNVESHRFYNCQVKNNPMRHEKSKNVDSTGKRRPALQGVIFGHHQKWGSPCC